MKLYLTKLNINKIKVPERTSKEKRRWNRILKKTKRKSFTITVRPPTAQEELTDGFMSFQDGLND